MKKFFDEYGEYFSVSKDELHNNLLHELDSHLHEYIEHVPTKNVRIYDSIIIDGNFDLEEIQSKGVSTIVVIGDLKVGGSILSNLGGAFLFVYGTTKAKNLFAGTPIISLNKALISDFTFGSGNKGILFIKVLKTQIFMNFDEHHSVIDDSSNINISYFDNSAYMGRVPIQDQDDFLEYLFMDKSMHSIVFKTEEENPDDSFISFGDWAIHDLLRSNDYENFKKKIMSYVLQKI